MTDSRSTVTDEEALAFHRASPPGKISVKPTKAMATQRDLSLAYSPGVAAPVREIARDPNLVYTYTSKGNLVAVISNGSAILGLGDLGAMASKPVMEGKSVLFKRFADVDSIDLEVDQSDPDAFVACVRALGVSFGGINLEDIKSPECFVIEKDLRNALDIPVFHDDQHGTAIIAAAGMINACQITGRSLEGLKVVVCGAGAAGLSCARLLLRLGVKQSNLTMCDREGVIYQGRTSGMDVYKAEFAIQTDERTLVEAVAGADALLGLSVRGAVSPDMIASMADKPIVFAMANPDPEITPEEVRAIRSDAIIATGRSDYPNQVNNVLGFPYIFRGALDVHASAINDQMKVAAARALAELARQDVPDEVAAAYSGERLSFGPDYIIPTPFDPRLIWHVPPYVAKAAMDSGVARKPISDMDAYRESLARRLDPSAAFIQRIHGAVRGENSLRRIVFAEGEEQSVIRAALDFRDRKLGHPILIGQERWVDKNMRELGVAKGELDIINARLSDRNPDYMEFLYRRLQRRGYLQRDVQRLVNNDRNVFGACMVALGDADGMVTGITRSYDAALRDVRLVIDGTETESVMGLTIVIARTGPIFVADTNVTELPGAAELADLAVQTARVARRMGYQPRVALLSYSTFGNPPGERAAKVRQAVSLLDARDDLDFEYEGEMSADVALDPVRGGIYGFSRLTGPANVLIMPAIHSASISTHLLAALGDVTVIGPLLIGLGAPVQIANLGATVSDLVNLAAFAAYDPHPRAESTVDG